MIDEKEKPVKKYIELYEYEKSKEYYLEEETSKLLINNFSSYIDTLYSSERME